MACSELLTICKCSFFNGLHTNYHKISFFLKSISVLEFLDRFLGENTGVCTLDKLMYKKLRVVYPFFTTTYHVAYDVFSFFSHFFSVYRINESLF